MFPVRSLQVCRTCLSLFLICASMTKDEQGRNRRTTSSLCCQCCSGRLLATRATGHNLGGQMRLLAISHLALTMQFPLNCKVHTAQCEGEGGSASGDMLKTIVEEHTHRHKETQSLRHSLHSFVFPVAVGGPSCCLFAELLSSVVTSATQAAIKD